MISNRIYELLERFETGQASAQDLLALEAWYDGFESDPKLTDQFPETDHEAEREMLLRRIHMRISTHRNDAVKPVKRRVTVIQRWLAAAVVLLVCAFGGYLLINTLHEKVQLVQQNGVDFAPGSNKAVLTLSSGQEIVLSDATTGYLAEQGEAVIEKTADGKLVYAAGSGVSGRTPLLNTVSTPRGGQYQLVLADGTKVWLNAESAITYPAAFTGTVREVSVRGEAFFEVAKDMRHPFRVACNGQSVQVLGTSFNVQAYADEGAMKTTLVEGSVRVEATGHGYLLVPGQQAIVSDDGVVVVPVNTEEFTAWKTGFFDFTDADIRTVMQQFARWYDVEVVFDGPITTDTFTGRLPRSWSLAKVMDVMQASQSVTLTASGRRIMVK